MPDLYERLQVPRTPVWRFLVTAGVILLPLVLVTLYFLDPADTPAFPRCPLHALTGWQCPGCGTARALHAALHGRFAEAWRFNAALPFALAALALCLAFPRHARSPRFAWGVLAATLAWGILRNL